MRDLPSGTVTFLFTGHRGEHPPVGRAPGFHALALARHDEIAASLVEEFVGTLVKSRGEGDSLCAIFALATAALQVTIAIS